MPTPRVPEATAAIAVILRPEAPTPGETVCPVSDRNAILMTRRPAKAVYGGYWELPGGKVEPGESPESAVVREVREEIGCDVVAERRLGPIVHTYEHARVTLIPVLCRLEPPDQRVQHLEVTDHAWRRLNDLPWDVFLPANVRVITALVRTLSE